jgi:REP element-mobilizing transposase RayT
MSPSTPIAYLITFTCYGTRLHGDEEGSVDRGHNIPGSPFLPPRRGWAITDQRRMRQQPYKLDRARRQIVLRALQQHCAHRGWTLLAAHVRSTHVHIVVAAEQAPERILTEVKAYASRALNRCGWERTSPKRWTHHGSTRYLWQPPHVAAAVEYVLYAQGEPMAMWRGEAPG